MAVFKNTPPLVTNGLTVVLDAANRQSYISGSSTWANLTPSYTSSATINTASLFDGISLTPQSGSTVALTDFFPNGNPTFINQQATVSLWMKIPEGSTTNPNIIFYSGGTSSNLIYFYRNPGSGVNSYGWLVYYTATTGNSFYLVNLTYPSYEWVNTVLTYTSTGTASTYINSILRNTQTIANFTQWNLVAANTPSINLSSAGKNPGSFGALHYYNRALSQAEITQNYNATKARFGLT
jgi:hypothetical protein